MLTGLNRIAEKAKIHPKQRELIHLINETTLKEVHRKQEKRKATGIDRVTKEEYEINIEENIKDLIERMKKLQYRPQAVRRVYIPKAGSDKMRPLGIPAYEDKLIQGVMAEILEEIYEPKFYRNSYGFRRNKSCHEAIKAVKEIVEKTNIGYIVDADIESFFDNVDHKWMMTFLKHEIMDKKFLRYIGRFLRMGIMEYGKKIESDKGTPQGGIISPILANVYLHYVQDDWFEREYKKKCKGEAYLIRYADDSVAMFEKKEEAERYYEELKERMRKFGLKIQEEKSKIIKFGKYALKEKETFDFLGFTHKGVRTKQGKYKLLRLTSKKKQKSKKEAVKKWLKENMHEKTADLIKKINQKLIGHYRYYGIAGNRKRMDEFRNYIIEELKRVLNRRSQKANMTWERYKKIIRYNPIVSVKIYYQTV